MYSTVEARKGFLMIIFGDWAQFAIRMGVWTYKLVWNRKIVHGNEMITPLRYWTGVLRHLRRTWHERVIPHAWVANLWHLLRVKIVLPKVSIYVLLPIVAIWLITAFLERIMMTSVIVHFFVIFLIGVSSHFLLLEREVDIISWLFTLKRVLRKIIKMERSIDLRALISLIDFHFLAVFFTHYVIFSEERKESWIFPVKSLRFVGIELMIYFFLPLQKLLPPVCNRVWHISHGRIFFLLLRLRFACVIAFELWDKILFIVI